LKDTGNCPICHGQSPVFRQARMMDRNTSERDFIEMLFKREPMDFENRQQLKEILINILTFIDIYNLDLKSAIITSLKDLINIEK
jgi:hypothetical protein